MHSWHNLDTDKYFSQNPNFEKIQCLICVNSNEIKSHLNYGDDLNESTVNASGITGYGALGHVSP
jgi:hypothetical protein